MTKPLTAKERKRRVQERSKAAIVKRRSSRVKVYYAEPVKSMKDIHPSFFSDTRQPHGMSAEARFMELRPSGISPLDWIGLFTPDEDLWEAIAEEAVFEFTGGDK